MPTKSVEELEIELAEEILRGIYGPCRRCEGSNCVANERGLLMSCNLCHGFGLSLRQAYMDKAWELERAKKLAEDKDWNNFDVDFYLSA